MPARAPSAACGARPSRIGRTIHRELRRAGVTLMLLWQEYRQAAPEGYGYIALLRDLRRMGTPAVADHAPGPSGRRAAVRRLCRPDGRTDRRHDRRDAAGAGLRRRARRLQLHLCRGELDPDAAGLDRRPCPRARLHRRRAAPDRAGQPQGRRAQGQLVRAGHQSDLSGPGLALRHRDPAGAAAQATRQGQGRGRRAGGRALDPGASAPSPLLLARRVQCGHRRPARRPQRPADAPSRHQPAAAVRGTRPPGARARCRASPMSTPNGGCAGSGSTITSTSTAITTPCRITC